MASNKSISASCARSGRGGSILDHKSAVLKGVHDAGRRRSFAIGAVRLLFFDMVSGRRQIRSVARFWGTG